MFCLQKELATIVDMTIKLYYEDVPRKGDRFLTKMQELMKKAME
jgi:hypothetical protein